MKTSMVDCEEWVGDGWSFAHTLASIHVLTIE